MIRLRNFKGMLPKVLPGNLPPGYARTCDNVEIIAGALGPHREDDRVTNLAGIVDRAAVISGAWRPLAQRSTGWVRGPVATSRFYFTQKPEPGSPALPPRLRVYGDTIRDQLLKVLAPAIAPSYIITGGTVNPNEFEDVRFAYTHVTDLGEESAPSPLSPITPFSPGMSITLGNFGAPQPDRGVTTRHIYRTVTDFAGSAVLHYVGRMTIPPGNDANFVYTLAGDPIQEPLPTADFAPPRDTMQGITAMGNGMIAGFFNRTVCFCEPYQPHAWPTKYELLVDADIIGLSAFGSSVAVLTTGAPFIISGTHPANLTMTRWQEVLPCSAADSIADAGFSSYYASPVGLVKISEQGAQVVTQGLFSSDDWRGLEPASFQAVMVDGRYTFLYGDRTRGPLALNDVGIVDLTGEMPFFLRDHIPAKFLAVHPGTLALHYLVPSPDGIVTPVWRADSGSTRRPYTWRSGALREPMLTNFGWAYVSTEGGGPNLDVRLYGGPSMDLICRVTDPNEPVRLPAGRLEQAFEVEIAGDAIVREVAFASSLDELVAP